MPNLCFLTDNSVLYEHTAHYQVAVTAVLLLAFQRQHALAVQFQAKSTLQTHSRGVCVTLSLHLPRNRSHQLLGACSNKSMHAQRSATATGLPETSAQCLVLRRLAACSTTMAATETTAPGLFRTTGRRTGLATTMAATETAPPACLATAWKFAIAWKVSDNLAGLSRRRRRHFFVIRQRDGGTRRSRRWSWSCCEDVHVLGLVDKALREEVLDALVRLELVAFREVHSHELPWWRSVMPQVHHRIFVRLEPGAVPTLLREEDAHLVGAAVAEPHAGVDLGLQLGDQGECVHLSADQALLTDKHAEEVHDHRLRLALSLDAVVVRALALVAFENWSQRWKSSNAGSSG